MSRIAFLFPGQGSQHAGMGRALAEAFPVSRRVFEEADAALGFPLASLCFEGGDAELARTENTQPAVLAVSIAALRALEAEGLRAVAVAGHSLGEYSAHVSAGTLRFADALRTVWLRGRFMQEAVPAGQGAMAAILGLERRAVERACAEAAEGEVVQVANLNGPDQVVVAGHAEAVARAAKLARAAGAARAVILPVSAPFHCSLMQPAAQRLAEVLADTSFADPHVPVYCNVDASPVTTAAASRDALVRQVASPVRWQESVLSMVGAGIDTFLEIGPGKVLTGLVRRIHPGARVLAVSDPDGVALAVREARSAA